ncbi:MAG: SDR family NAD(P)-dependent oxidoreductase [Vulcanimicrobiaceae bacterium]
MLLENKTAVIYGGAGAVGSAVARAFAAEGAKVFLSGRRLSNVEAVAKEITASGGTVDAAQVDALDERSVEEYVQRVIDVDGKIDISFASIGVPQEGVQGIPLLELPTESFMHPINAYARSHFITARAAARHMVQKRSGVILTHTPEVSRIGAQLVGGMAPSWAAMEALTRNLSAELGSYGVRAVGIRSTGLPETETIDVVFGLHAKTIGIARQQFQGMIESMTHTKRSTTLREVQDAFVFAASDRASSITGATLNLTGGLVVDW